MQEARVDLASFGYIVHFDRRLFDSKGLEGKIEASCTPCACGFTHEWYDKYVLLSASGLPVRRVANLCREMPTNTVRLRVAASAAIETLDHPEFNDWLGQKHQVHK